MAENQQPQTPAPKGPTIFGMHPLKLVFALEYVLQGLGNPFQGITYQPFIKHFGVTYGLDEAATQNYFARSYLAWSFKPVLGFFIDAYGRTRTVLVAMLGIATLLYLLTPVFDTSPEMFFWYMFGLSVVMAATDVAVDRATVVEGDAEAQATGQSKSTTVGLNQSICWAAIYGTGIVSSVAGGWIADNADFKVFITLLAMAPLAVLLVTLKLPKDVAEPIPLRRSILNFWQGLNTGPILWIVVFYFLFHFQPAAGALMTNYALETLKFTQSEVGYSDGASYLGYFIGVLIFARYGVRWQDAIGLRRIFKIFIVLSVLASLTQNLMLDPWFTRGANVLHTVLPFLDESTARIAWLSTYNLSYAVFLGFTRMSTFSLVGAVIPANAAGSLFAGFMSVANLAYSFSYSSGSLIYSRGLEFAPVRWLQETVYGIPAIVGEHASMSILIFIGSVAYLLSLLAAHMLPDQRQTRASDEDEDHGIGPAQFATLGADTLKGINTAFFVCMASVFSALYFGAGSDPIQCVLMAFFGSAFLRKVLLDRLYTRSLARG